jgi:predicted ATP-grasp superfamily ATP-dependent carboligase
MSGTSCLLVHEYLSSGYGEEWPAEMAREGVAMLAAFLADCANWGRVRTLVTLDCRLAGRSLPAGELLLVEPGHGAGAFEAALARCDAALVIAPETGGLLAGLSRRVLAANVKLIGSAPEAVDLAGDKWACYQRWQAALVPTPLTRLVSATGAAPVAAEMGYPLVVKPSGGAGCAGVSLVRTPSDLAAALQLAGQAAGLQPILLQRFVPGKHASVSLLVAGTRSLALSLNGQDVEIGLPFSYRGGAVPLHDRAERQALAVARQAVAALPGLAGYVGVDLVLDGDAAWAIEINPRLTTAYVGLRQVATGINLAGAIWGASVDGVLPAAVSLHGRAVFAKDGAIRLEETA